MTPTTGAPEASAPAYSDWQGATGEGWAADASHYETMLANVGAALLDHAGLTPGEHAPARHPGLVRAQPGISAMIGRETVMRYQCFKAIEKEQLFPVGPLGRPQRQSGPMVALRLRGRRQARLAQEPVGE